MLEHNEIKLVKDCAECIYPSLPGDQTIQDALLLVSREYERLDIALPCLDQQTVLAIWERVNLLRMQRKG